MNPRLGLFFLRHYCFLALLAAFACSIGAKLSKRVAYCSASEKFSFCTALGLGATACLVFLLGLLHLLTPVVLLVLFASLAVWFAPSWIGMARAAAQFWRIAPTDRQFLYCGALLFAIPILLLPLYPPTQWDATSYHLAAAKIFVNSHAVVETPYLRMPVFPQLNEMLFALALTLYDDLSAQMVQLLMMILVAIGLYAWGSRVFSARVGLWSAALWLANPLVIWLGASAYVDIGLVLFVVLAAYAFFNWFQSREIAWLVVSAAMTGFAAGSKYSGLVPFGAFEMVLLYLAVKERRFRALLAFTAIAMAIASPWYIRNAWYMGNPIWPSMGSTLGYGIWSPLDAQKQFGELSTYGAGKGFGALLRLPWNLAFHPRIFHGELPLSPVYLYLLPFCVVAAIRDSYIRSLLLAAGIVALSWFATIQVLRYLLPALPLIGIAEAAALDKCLFSRKRPRSPVMSRLVAGTVCVLLLVPGAISFTTPSLIGPFPIPKAYPPAKTGQRDSYLAQFLPAYPAIEFLNRLQGDRYTLFSLENANMAYFADGRFMGDWFGPARYSAMTDRAERPLELYQELHRLGSSYLLVDGNGILGGDFLDSLLPPELLESHFKLIFVHASQVLIELEDRPVQLAPANELVKNGGFEQSIAGAPADWIATGTPLMSSGDASSHGGGAAVRIDPENFLIQKVPVKSGAIYLLRQFSRAAGKPLAVRLQVNWLDKKSVTISAEIRTVPALPDWHGHVMAVSPPPNAAWASVFASVQEPGQAWFDDFSFVEVKYR